MDAAEFVVGDVNGPGEEPKNGEGEKANGEAFGDRFLAAARKKDRGKRGASGAEGHDVFAAIGTGAERLRGDPDEPSDGVSEQEVQPSLLLHATRDISSKRKNGNRIQREEKKPLDRGTKVKCAPEHVVEELGGASEKAAGCGDDDREWDVCRSVAGAEAAAAAGEGCGGAGE